MDQSFPEDEKLLMFIRGELSQEEQDAIEAEIEENPRLKAHVDQLLIAQTIVWKAGKEEEAQYFKSLYESPQTATSTTIKPMFGRKAIALAASLLILVAVAVFVFIQPSEPSMGELYTAHYERPAAPEQLAISPTNLTPADSLEKLGFAALNAGNMREAKRLLKSLSEYPNRENATEIQFFIGISELESGNAQQALTAFQNMAGSREASQWYSLLAYIQLEDQEAVQQSLDTILADEGHFYRKKALEIQRDLK